MNRLSSSLRRRLFDAVMPWQTRPNRENPSPPENWTDESLPVPDVRPGKGASWTVTVVYCDSSGSETERTITIRRIQTSKYGKVNIMAFCHLRKAVRAFSIDRIRECYDMRSGELVDHHRLFSELASEGLPLADANLARLVQILVFISLCDGEMHRLEHESIESAITGYVMRIGGDDQTVADAVSLSRAIQPSGADFLTALYWLSRSSDARQIARLALHYVAQVINADGILHEAEIEWFTPVRDSLEVISGL